MVCHTLRPAVHVESVASQADAWAGFMVRPLLVFQSSIFAICLHVIDGIMKLIDKIGIDVVRKIV
jgi:hypothetical protein